MWRVEYFKTCMMIDFGAGRIQALLQDNRGWTKTKIRSGGSTQDILIYIGHSDKNEKSDQKGVHRILDIVTN